MHFQGRRNTCNMLLSLKEKQGKVWTSSHKIYQAKVFCWHSISKRDEIMSSFRWMHRIKENHVSISYLANISLQYKLLGTWRELLVALCGTVCYNIALCSATKPIFGSLAESDMRNEPLHMQSAT